MSGNGEQEAGTEGSIPLTEVAEMVETAVNNCIPTIVAAMEPIIERAITKNLAERLQGSSFKIAVSEALTESVVKKRTSVVGRDDVGDGVEIYKDDEEESLELPVATFVAGKPPDHQRMELWLPRSLQKTLLSNPNMRAVMEQLLKRIHPEVENIGSFYLGGIGAKKARQEERRGRKKLPNSSYELLRSYFGGTWGGKWKPDEKFPLQGMALAHFRETVKQVFSIARVKKAKEEKKAARALRRMQEDGCNNAMDLLAGEADPEFKLPD